MFCIGVYETQKELIKEMRGRLAGYSVQTDQDFDILWITEMPAAEKMDAYALRMQLVFISLDSPSGKYLGEQIYRLNPDCRICYYKSEKCDLEPVLSARPIAFYLREQDGQAKGSGAFSRKLDGLLREVLGSGRVFRYETRKTNYVFWARDILYFQSDLKYVEIHTKSQEPRRIFAKLTEIEKRLEESGIHGSFLRIHKSYLVNIVYVQALDKVSHMVRLLGGESLPVSDAQYADVAKRLTYL